MTSLYDIWYGYPIVFSSKLIISQLSSATPAVLFQCNRLEKDFTPQDLQPIVNVSGNLQGYLVHGQTPFLLTPVSGSSHLFTVHQNGKETPSLSKDQTFPA